MDVNKVVLITNNLNGGILQMAGELLVDLVDMGIDVRVFIPSNNKLIVPISFESRIITYDFGNNKMSRKINELLPGNRLIRDVMLKIQQEAPDMIWTLDDKPFTSLLGNELSKKYYTYMTVHDYIFHPTYNHSMKKRIYCYIWNRYRKKYMSVATGLITMSMYEYELVVSNETIADSKVYCLQLGAHIPKVAEKKPKEINEFVKTKYNLFFGRIEKYKGIDDLLSSYLKFTEKTPLIIAGEGNIRDEWGEKILSDRRILVINRYIEDDEMVWLIKNANCVILPYNESSQSGVLSISYHYGVPVVSSNAPGLTQNIVNGKTGIICEKIEEYTDAYLRMESKELRGSMSKNAKAYYFDNLDWIPNLKKLFEWINNQEKKNEK